LLRQRQPVAAAEAAVKLYNVVEDSYTQTAGLPWGSLFAGTSMPAELGKGGGAGERRGDIEGERDVDRRGDREEIDRH